MAKKSNPCPSFPRSAWERTRDAPASSLKMVASRPDAGASRLSFPRRAWERWVMDLRRGVLVHAGRNQVSVLVGTMKLCPPYDDAGAYRVGMSFYAHQNWSLTFVEL